MLMLITMVNNMAVKETMKRKIEEVLEAFSKRKDILDFLRKNREIFLRDLTEEEIRDANLINLLKSINASNLSNSLKLKLIENEEEKKEIISANEIILSESFILLKQFGKSISGSLFLNEKNNNLIKNFDNKEINEKRKEVLNKKLEKDVEFISIGKKRTFRDLSI